MNIINAIINLINNPVTELQETYKSKNRANNMGDALEEYVKDLFANTFNFTDESKRLEELQRVFSYLGNNSNPPDAMLKGGDAIEVKKIESKNAALALNSSYPKQKLFSSSTMISDACKNAEVWNEKDMIYIVGIVDGKKLKNLSFVYGLDYCAIESTYAGLKTKIKDGIHSIGGIDFTETKELGHINKVDPLGITYMRVRGMWGIENPFKVFDYAYKRDFTKDFNFMSIINESKWNEFDNTNELMSLVGVVDNLEVIDIKVKNPDNPAQLRNAKLIKLTK
mgnify:CR=1 FL=1